ncbi:hypothetical protein N9112_00110 [bacterium]|nr:hypothetical protein [bacterium]
MSYGALIDSQLSTTFTALKDLAVDATFTKEDQTGYDLVADMPETTIEQPIVVKAVKIKELTKKNTSTLTLLVKSKDVGDIGEFSELAIDGIVYRVGQVHHNHIYVVMFDAVREG